MTDQVCIQCLALPHLAYLSFRRPRHAGPFSLKNPIPDLTLDSRPHHRQNMATSQDDPGLKDSEIKTSSNTPPASTTRNESSKSSRTSASGPAPPWPRAGAGPGLRCGALRRPLRGPLSTEPTGGAGAELGLERLRGSVSYTAAIHARLQSGQLMLYDSCRCLRTFLARLLFAMRQNSDISTGPHEAKFSQFSSCSR